MSYTKKVADLAKEILDTANQIDETKAARSDWIDPWKTRIYIGYWIYVVQKDGRVTPGLEGVQRGALASIDQRLHMLHSKLEGLRWRLVQLGKEGGAA